MVEKWRKFALGGGLAGAALAVLAAQAPSLAQETIKIGHVAALSGGSAQSGEAITRGLTIAIEEVNAKGGLLGGRKLELIQRDDKSVPPKGVVAARELIAKEKVVALFGGINSPVALATVPVVNKEKVPYMAVWAAGTGITRNGADPNFVFRVSRPSTSWSTSSCSTTPARNSARRSPGCCWSTTPGAPPTRRAWSRP